MSGRCSVRSVTSSKVVGLAASNAGGSQQRAVFLTSNRAMGYPADILTVCSALQLKKLSKARLCQPRISSYGHDQPRLPR